MPCPCLLFPCISFSVGNSVGNSIAFSIHDHGLLLLSLRTPAVGSPCLSNLIPFSSGCWTVKVCVINPIQTQGELLHDKSCCHPIQVRMQLYYSLVLSCIREKRINWFLSSISHLTTSFRLVCSMIALTCDSCGISLVLFVFRSRPTCPCLAFDSFLLSRVSDSWSNIEGVDLCDTCLNPVLYYYCPLVACDSNFLALTTAN